MMNRRQLFGWLSALPFVPAAFTRPRPTFTPPSTVYIALAEPIREVSGAEYARTAIMFPAPTANWGEPTSFSLMTGDEPDFIDMHYRPNLPEWF